MTEPLSENERKIRYCAITTLQDLRLDDKRTKYEHSGLILYTDLLERVSELTDNTKERVRTSLKNMIALGIIKVTNVVRQGPHFTRILKLSDLA